MYRAINKRLGTYWTLHIEYNDSPLSKTYKLTPRDYKFLNKVSGGRKRLSNILSFDFNKFGLDYTPEYYQHKGKTVCDYGDAKYRAFGYVYLTTKLLIDTIINLVNNKENIKPA